MRIGESMTETNNIPLPLLHCQRCGHKWTPRKDCLPKVCPKCKNPNWNKEAVQK